MRGGAQLQERIKYITSLPAASALTVLNGNESKAAPVGNKAGQEFYQNMCMKAVNQVLPLQPRPSTLNSERTVSMREVWPHSRTK